LWAKVRAIPNVTVADFVELARRLGFAIVIQEHRPFEVGGSTCGEALSNGTWVFCFRIVAPELSPAFFSAGVSAAGDPLVSAANEPLSCALERVKPAHLHGLYSFSEIYSGTYQPWKPYVVHPAPIVIEIAPQSPQIT
jgi:uncharacterized protein YmfQ (DUF2313 family)